MFIPRLLASVTEDEPEVPLDVMDEEMERDLVGRQEPESATAQLSIELQGEHTPEERRHHD